MKSLPFARLCLLIGLAVIVSSAVSFEVCLATGNIPAMTAVLVASLAITLTPIIRWWLKSARAAGVPKTELTRSRMVTAAMAFLVLLATIAVEVAAADVTHMFVVEVLVAIGGAIAVAAVTAKSIAEMPASNAASLGMLRFSAIVAAAIVPIFSANLWLQMHSRHSDTFGPLYHKIFIAGYLLIIAVNAINAYRFWRRWEEARPRGSEQTLAR